jgi:nicotinate-nucleotide adenylyltransferase
MDVGARRIGILGGTFDPIHCGHLDVADAAQRALSLTRMFVITSNIPPHRQHPHSSAFHRFAMVSLAVLDRPDWRASDLELRLNAPSYTSGTLERFHERGFSATELFFVIGADAFTEIETWRDYPRILDAAHFVVVSRPGTSAVGSLRERLPRLAPRMVEPPSDPLDYGTPLIILIDAQTADVSSSAIRDRRAIGESIAGLVPPNVRQHIEQHGLYRPMTPGRRAIDAPPPTPAGGLHGEE